MLKTQQQKRDRQQQPMEPLRRHSIHKTCHWDQRPQVEGHQFHRRQLPKVQSSLREGHYGNPGLLSLTEQWRHCLRYRHPPRHAAASQDSIAMKVLCDRLRVRHLQ